MTGMKTFVATFAAIVAAAAVLWTGYIAYSLILVNDVNKLDAKEARRLTREHQCELMRQLEKNQTFHPLSPEEEKILAIARKECEKHE
jgi:hypothetical protein